MRNLEISGIFKTIFAPHRNAMKNWSRIQDHFFFSVFNPIRDYSVEVSSFSQTHSLTFFCPECIIWSVLCCYEPEASHSLLPQTIFQIFPLLSELAEDEWLPPWKFECFVDFPICAALPLKNPVTDLCELQPGDWIQQDKGNHHMRVAESWNHTTLMKTLTSNAIIFNNRSKDLIAVRCCHDTSKPFQC